MARTHEEIRQLTAEIDKARNHLTQSGSILVEKLNVPKHTAMLLKRYPSVWITTAGAFGWLLSRVPARKKKVYVLQSTGEKIGRKMAASRGKSISSHLWDLAWSVAKPAITFYFTRALSRK
jgi:hypothetical protein